jgi:DNA-binding XRE family transcriptional regulator
MTTKRIHRKIERTPAEQARLNAVREEFQATRPSLDDLAKSGDYSNPVTQGEYLEAKAIAKCLRQAREASNMSLAEVSKLTGIDRSAISRLENGLNSNTTINTLNRIACAYGKRITFHLEDSASQ